MVPRALYLVSSSANREYVADCLEVLALPRGCVHHFRYLERYVDDELWLELPLEPGRLPATLNGLTVVVVYLFQEQVGGAWKPNIYAPIRLGKLIDGFRDGRVAHLYFTIGDYVMQAKGGTAARLISPAEIDFKTNRSAEPRVSYAHLDRDLELGASVDYGDTRAFQEFADFGAKATQWRTRSLGSAPLDVSYDVIFYRVVGIFREARQQLTELALSESRLPGLPLSEYVLESGTVYYVKVVTHMPVRRPALLPGQGTARLSLGFDDTMIRSSGKTSIQISSPYDLEYLAIEPIVRDSRRTTITMTCKHDVRSDLENFLRREVLCADVSLQVSLRPARRGSARKL